VRWLPREREGRKGRREGRKVKITNLEDSVDDFLDCNKIVSTVQSPCIQVSEKKGVFFSNSLGTEDMGD